MSRADAADFDVWSGDGWVDVSRPLMSETPVWPGDRAFEIDRVMNGDLLVSAVATTSHVGTHVDAPLHLDPYGIAAHEIPIGRLLGPVEVVRLPTGCGAALPDDLPLGWFPRYPKVLFRSDSHPLGAKIDDGFAAVSAELVDWLAEHGVATLGIDTPSVDVFSSTELEAHHALVRSGMTWIEGLHLAEVEAGRYLMVALPMPLRGTEAAPVRALLKRLPANAP